MARGIKPEDDGLPLKDSPWTNEDTQNLHELARHFDTLRSMAEEYDRMQWLKRKALQIFVWGLGVPAAIIYFVEPVQRLIKFFKGH